MSCQFQFGKSILCFYGFPTHEFIIRNDLFRDFVTKLICIFNSITYQINDVGKFSFKLGYPSQVIYASDKKKVLLYS